MSIEGIALEQFSATYKETYALSPYSRTHNTEFHSFLHDQSKQYSATTAAHRKRIMDMLKRINFMGFGLSTVWDNTYGRADHYRCATSLYLLSILSPSFNIIIYHGISAPGQRREVIYGLNTTYKRFIFYLIATVQLPGSKWFDTKIEFHTATQNTDVSLV